MMKLYRGIIADDLKQAYKYIRSTNGTGASDYGNGVYFTNDIEAAKTYGNYVFGFEIKKSELKQVTPQNYLMTKNNFNKNKYNYNMELETFIDLGMNAKYKFTATTFKHYEETGEIR